jgi:glycerophosphoryl diester phosphodiesterase
MARGKYNKNFPSIAKEFAREGFVDIEIAKKLGISRASYYNYQLKYPEFRDAIIEGKIPVDIEIEDSLIKKAKGYYYEEKHTEIEIVNGEPKPKLIKTIKKHVPASDTAIIFWLKNRKPERWKDRSGIDHSSKDGSMTPQINITVSDTETAENIKKLNNEND